MLLRTLMVTRGAGIDPIQPRLRAAPDAEAGGELPIDRPRKGEPAVNEAVAAVKTDPHKAEKRAERAEKSEAARRNED